MSRQQQGFTDGLEHVIGEYHQQRVAEEDDGGAPRLDPAIWDSNHCSGMVRWGHKINSRRFGSFNV